MAQIRGECLDQIAFKPMSKRETIIGPNWQPSSEIVQAPANAVTIGQRMTHRSQQCRDHNACGGTLGVARMEVPIRMNLIREGLSEMRRFKMG
ncbi:MAG: hypothetical protein WBC04_17450 [Candidatus Acidiferrales bacterium]